MDYLELVKDKENELSELYTRMDADKDLLYLKKYIMKDASGRHDIPGIVNVTLNRPAVFHANVVSALGSTTEQVVVESEEKRFDTTYIEDFLKAAFSSADARLRKLHRFELNPYFDEQVCIRGRGAARCLFRMEDGIVIPDIVPWDTRYVVYEVGEDGLGWAAYKTRRKKANIESEYNITIEDKEGEVLDVWDKKVNEIWIDGEKRVTQPNPYGYVPVVIEMVSLGSLLADADSLGHQGESLFFLIREAIPELNRLVSIMQTLNLMAIKGPIQEEVAGEGRLAKPRDYDDTIAPGAVSAVDMGGGIRPIDYGDAQRSATIAYNMMDRAIQEGSLSSSDLGIIGSPPPSGITLIQIKEGRDQVFHPRLLAKARMKEALADMVIEQTIQIGGGVELGTRGHKRTFQTSKLQGEYEVTYKYFTKSNTIDAGLYSLAAAAGDSVSKKAKAIEILQREDPVGDEKQLRWEEAERLSPAVKIRRIIQSLLDQGEDVEAEILSAEAGVSLKQMLTGEAQQQPKPEKPETPKQVVSLFGGGTGRGQARPQPTEEGE